MNFVITLTFSLLIVQFVFSQNIKNYSLSDSVIANQLIDSARSFETSALYDSSIYYYKKARDIYLNLTQNYSEPKLFKHISFCSNKIGWDLMMQDKYNESLNVLEQNLLFSLERLGDNDFETAQCYNNIATSYWRLEHLDKALYAYQKALAIIKSLSGEENLKAANIYLNIGNVYADKGQFEKSIEIQSKALAIQIKLLGNEHHNIASSLNNLGLTYNQLGDYDKALEYLLQGLSLRSKLLKPNHPTISSSYNNIGNILFHTKNYDEAIEMHKKALEIRIINFGEENPMVAASYNNIGNSLFKKGDYDSALAMYQKSLSIRQNTLPVNHPDFAYNYMNLGSVYSVKNDFDNSLKFHRLALSFRLKAYGEKHPLTAGDYLNIAEVYFKKKEFDSSLYFSQKSIVSLVSGFDDTTTFDNPELKEISLPQKLLEALSLKAEIYYQLSGTSDLNNLILSLNTYNLAVELIDKIRTGYKKEGSMLLLSEEIGYLFEKAIVVCLRLHSITNEELYKQKAFYFIEKSKTAVLQLALNDSKAKEFSKIPLDKLQKEKELKSDLSFYETEFLNEQNKKQNKDSIKLYDYQQKLFLLSLQYEELIKEFENNYPAYFDLKYRNDNKSIPDIQNALDSKSLMLEYFVGDSIIFIISITKLNYDIVELKKPEGFESLVKRFYSAIIKSQTTEYIEATNNLSDILIKPASNKLSSNRKIIIIPHDILYKIPFEALFTKPQKVNSKDLTKLNYLIKEYEIIYHHSATLFVKSFENERRASLKNFIGFAPIFPKDKNLGYTISTVNTPLLASNDDIIRSVSVDGKNYDELKYSEWEVNSIIDLFNKNNSSRVSTAYFYADAKEDSFKVNVKDYKIVHIASHSFMNEDQPDISGVIFAQPTDSVYSNDGILYAAETYNLDLSADLVVLSSCESGLGKLFKGEGMIGLTRGFLYSGANNIIFSLWKIPDKHTSELMVEFYRQMISGKTYSESLRTAKLKLIENKITSRPRSWAGFLLIGR
ncbi:CHAT domain-containing tetratricopeptide repeat protein [Ignavibacterium sp.]|uniref:CHAT domain-containing tetratricopeptide repeat protein n=1 Tax=Ignavibacterium sp. TaxID=2651167 RepID=UPI00307EEC81